MKNSDSYLLPGTSINFYNLISLSVNGRRINKFSKFVPCLNRGSKLQQMEICFIKDETSMKFEELKFSTNDIKKCAAFLEDETLYGLKIIKKELNLELDLLIVDLQNRFRKNFVRRVSGYHTVDEFNSLLVYDMITWNTSIQEEMELATNLQLYLSKVNEVIPIQSDEFIKMITSPGYVICILLRMHKCWNSTCPEFSFKKCTGCMKARYCDEKCQKSDQEDHRMVCQSLAMDYKMETWAINRIDDLIESNLRKQFLTRRRSINDCLKEMRSKSFSDWIGLLKADDELIRELLELANWDKFDSDIFDKIISKKTFRKLLEAKKVKKQRIKDAMAEVD